MPLDHSNATATVSITGLALGCYNLATDKYEVGFIRHPDHVLTISVEIAKSEGEPAKLSFNVDQYHRIFIEDEGGTTPNEPFYKPTANFDRNADGQDREDFQWILDLDRELNGGQPVPLKPPADPVTEMYVSKPVLYADPEGFAIGKLKLVDTDNNNSVVRQFGRLGEIILGDITCADGGAVNLRLEGPLGMNLRLPRVQGKRHKIIMENLCPKPSATGGSPKSGSDFKVYYSLVQDTGGKKFDFQSENPAHNPDGVCNGSNLGNSGQLFPLPT